MDRAVCEMKEWRKRKTIEWETDAAIRLLKTAIIFWALLQSLLLSPFL